MVRILISVNLVLLGVIVGGGCRSQSTNLRFNHVAPPSLPATTAASEQAIGLVGYDRPELPDSAVPASLNTPESSDRPLTRRSELPSSFREISLQESIQLALQNLEVLRGLAANVVQNPAGTGTSFDPAIQFKNPNFGVDAALAQFDALASASVLYANNDDYFNNPSTTANAFEVQQDLTRMNFSMDKVAFNGTRLQVSSGLTHDNTSNPSVLFPSSWDYQWQATARRPLLQGAGVNFNRIAGPNARPGFFGTSGLLISRVNHDISIAEFERGVRQLALEIVDAYWQLDLAYRNFETIKAARNSSQVTWNIAEARKENGLPGGEADREAQARAQFYQFQLQLERALHGTGESGSPGILQAEANLRRLLNLPLRDNYLLRPSDTPTEAELLMDWNYLASHATSQRAEIRQQQKRVQQRDLELIAAKNFTMPRLDALATYRNSGFGDDLIGGGGKFSGALNEAWAGNYDEWEFGFNFDMPVGFRQARAGVRHAQLQACRERAVLEELQQQIRHELATALRSLDQSSNEITLATLRTQANQETVKARLAAYGADAVGFEDLLDSQQRLLEAELELHRSKTQRERALAQLNAEAGLLLQQFDVQLGCE